MKVLPQKTIKFINSLDHDDLVCFLSVYSTATTANDKEQYEALKEEMLKKLSNNNLEKELWETK
jgi:hypothetical protein